MAGNCLRISLVLVAVDKVVIFTIYRGKENGLPYVVLALNVAVAVCKVALALVSNSSYLVDEADVVGIDYSKMVKDLLDVRYEGILKMVG